MGLFRTQIRRLRESRNTSQREVAAFIKANTAFVCLMEKGDRQASREQVLKLAEMYQMDVDKLVTLWLAEKITLILEGEPTGKKAMRLAEKELYKRNEKE